MLASAIFEVPTGVWSDRVGRRNTIIIGSWSRVLAFIFYAIGRSYWWLVIGAILEGLSRSFFSGNNDAFLHDTLADESRTSDYHLHLGKISSAEHLGIALSAAIGGYIGSFSFTLLMWLSVIPQLIMALVNYTLTEPITKHHHHSNVYSHIKEAIKLFVTNKRLRQLSITDAVSFSTGEVSFQFRASFFASIWPAWAIGILNTLVQFGASASYYFGHILIKKFGHSKLLLIRSIMGKIGSLIAFGIPSIFSPLITIIPSFVYGAGQVSKNTLMQREFTNEQRATMSSLNSLLSSVGFALTSVLVGLFADYTTPQVALLTLAIISVPIVFVYWQLFKEDK